MMRAVIVHARRAALASCGLIVLLAGSAWCAGPNWVLIDENKDSSFYFDQSGAKKPGEATVQVRTRVLYTEKGKAEALKYLEGIKNIESLSESRYLHELDCKKEASRLLEASHLDAQGVTLKTTDLAAVSEWEEIPPLARMGLVLDKVCPQPSQ